MLAIVQIVLLSVTGFLLLYLAFLSLVAFLKRNETHTETGERRRFAIVIPAYNEEDDIGDTIKRLAKVDYDPSLFDIIVVADNCTDATAKVAKKEGAIVMIRNNPHKRGKGYALRWCFDRLLETKTKHKYDAVVVVDADTYIYDNMLNVMNTYREDGADVIQGYLTVDSKPDVWTSEMIRIGFTLYNYVRPIARKALGVPAGLRGNGMCFSLEVLEKVPWDAYSLTEDLEYGIKLLLNDIDVAFAPEAIGHNVVPENAKNAESQRERWEMGRFPILRKYAGLLFKEALRRRSFKIFDTLIDLITPPVVNMMLFVILMTGVSFLLWLTGFQQSLIFTELWLVVLSMGLFHALVGLYAARVEWSVYRSLFYVPRYAVWKLYIYLKVLLVKGRTTEWIRTSRESN